LAAGGYERSLIYSGLRGVGKTVLLMELDVLASEAGGASTDVQEVGSQPDFRVTFARIATRLLREMSRRHRIKDRVDRALGVVKAFSVVAPLGVQFKLDVDATAGVADSGDPEQDLSDLVQEISEVAKTTGAAGCIDPPRRSDSKGPHLGSPPRETGLHRPLVRRVPTREPSARLVRVEPAEDRGPVRGQIYAFLSTQDHSIEIARKRSRTSRDPDQALEIVASDPSQSQA